MAKYIDADKTLNSLPDDLPYKASVKRVLTQAPAEDVVELDDCFEIVIVSAVRYAIGRQTYVPHSVIQFISPILSKLSHKTLSVLERDISEANSYGDKVIDEPAWIKFLSDIRKEKDK